MQPRKYFQRPNYAVRARKLKELGFKDYNEYLASNWWRTRRRDYAASVPRACAFCGREEAIDLHHSVYDNLGDESNADLQWLCSDHHEELHGVGYIGRPTGAQREILQSHGYKWDQIALMSFGDAYRLIGEIGDRVVTTPGVQTGSGNAGTSRARPKPRPEIDLSDVIWLSKEEVKNRP